MAKHKKKKSEPTPDPRDSQKKESDVPEKSTENETPPTEKIDDSTSKTTEAEPSDVKRKVDKLFWLRIGLAVIAGSAATFIFEPIEGEERRWASIGFMIVIFIVSIGIAKGMKIQLPSSDRKKIVTTGIGSYVFIYLFMWILTYTLVHVSSTGTIPSPIS